MNAEDAWDLAVVGAGIVGLACAREITERNPGLRVVVLEKSDHVAAGQSGHNSNVLHTGLYYKPGSLKARLCVAGREAMAQLCRERSLPLVECGKVVVATRGEERAPLEELWRRGRANGVADLELVDATRLRRIEPEAAGVAGLHVPHAAIVDFPAICRTLAAELEDLGVSVQTSSPVLAVDRREGWLELRLPGRRLRARRLLNCAGVHSDRLARGMGAAIDLRILPFRGEYHWLHPRWSSRVRGLIYPVPDPRLPFLGVHVTPTVRGEVEAGPNAVLAFSREGYRRRDLDLRDLAEVLGFGGFWRMVRRFGRTGMAEMARSFSRRLLLRDLQRLLPAVTLNDLLPGASGVRAQAVEASGRLVDDFRIVAGEGAMHVLNAPSPAATAALAIAAHLADQARESLSLR